MRYGRTSMVVFLSKLVMSLSGFVATIVLTRTLGQENYGTYVIVLSVLAWAAIPGNLGIRAAVKKRISENTGGNYVISGLVLQSVLYITVAFCLWLIHPYLNTYMGVDSTKILIILLGGHLFSLFIQAVLDGQHLVHLSSILTPIEWLSRSIVQVILVVLGFGLAGAFAGYLVGAMVAIAVGIYFASVDWSLPSRQEFAHIKSFAQFSWLAPIKGRTFLSMDTLILAFFVSNSLVAVYEIAWNIASLFSLFGSSVTKTLFPEMSKISSAKNTNDEISELLHISLSYIGLFIIPGLVGSLLVGDVILTIYGSGFKQGYYILFILTFARLLYGYMDQFNSTLDAIDRPDITFRINIIFVITNLFLNIILTSQYGWYGAAVATTMSALVGLSLGYHYTNKYADVNLPGKEISKQIFSALIMGVIVYVCHLLLGNSLPITILIVMIGSSVYFIVLILISEEFKNTVLNNLPDQISGNI